jgi:PTH2 family peptidyl-tRNA hydrolase
MEATKLNIEVKQIIVMRTDLNMRKGKMCAQASHACMYHLKSLLGKESNMDEEDKAYYNGSWKKVCVQVGSEKELMEIYQKARQAKLKVFLVTDSGKTEFNNVPTKTCLCIGPNKEENIDKITGGLKLL